MFVCITELSEHEMNKYMWLMLWKKLLMIVIWEEVKGDTDAVLHLKSKTLIVTLNFINSNVAILMNNFPLLFPLHKHIISFEWK